METKTTQGRIAFAIVKGSLTPENPEGNAKIAWDRLTAKYSPQTALMYMKFERQFATSKLMSAASNHDVWLTKLESVQIDMNKCLIAGKTDKLETDLIIHVLANLPKEYLVTVNDLKKDIKAGKTVTIKDVREGLNEQFD